MIRHVTFGYLISWWALTLEETTWQQWPKQHFQCICTLTSLRIGCRSYGMMKKLMYLFASSWIDSLRQRLHSKVDRCGRSMSLMLRYACLTQSVVSRSDEAASGNEWQERPAGFERKRRRPISGKYPQLFP